MQDRRTFLKSIGASALSISAVRDPRSAIRRPQSAVRDPQSAIRKAVLISMLPKELSFAERFKVGREAGFDGIEMQTVTQPEIAAEIHEASKQTGLRIHSVMNMAHWESPLSSDDPQVVSRSVAGMEASLRNAALWGADAVLLVPAVVNPATSYRQAWERSQRVIKERLLPLARELKVIIAVEEVWNKFLLSPLEFARYVDDFQSPWLKAYFDVGNVVFYGYPQDWIRTLGPRIVKVHLKDFQLDRPNGRFEWKNIGDGEIDWADVRRALTEIKYKGYVTTEVRGGSPEYIKDVANRVDKLLGLAPPGGLAR
jgi:L-ribulose-5-phosphate 3-epimerase